MKKLRKVFNFLYTNNQNLSDINTGEKPTCRFLPNEICGTYEIFMNQKQCETCYLFNKEIITQEVQNTNPKERVQHSFQVIKYDFSNHKCVARKMDFQPEEKEFVAFYFEKKFNHFYKLLTVEFTTINEAEQHRLPVDTFKAKTFKWQWICKN